MGRIWKRREILAMLLLATLASPAMAQAPGNARAYALQPVSLSGEVALNVSVGISTIELRWIP
jgi:hypothetical protein